MGKNQGTFLLVMQNVVSYLFSSVKYLNIIKIKRFLPDLI